MRAQTRGGRSIERAKPVASSSCSANAGLTRPVIGHAERRGKIGKARIGNSARLNFSGASRCGTFAKRNSERSSHGLPALTESELAGVPIGGAAMVSARMPHIGAAARAIDTQPNDSTNAVRVQSRTNQAFRV